MANSSVLDSLFANHPITSEIQPTSVSPDDLVHVIGSQEPVREQPDRRTRFLLQRGWLTVDYVQVQLPENARANLVASLQKAARAWMKQADETVKPADREQARWLVEKTRSHESKQQIAQRVWLAVVLYGLGLRGLRFDAQGQIHWQEGLTGRIGISPDAAIDLAWAQPGHKIFTASFRQPDGTITRGKGRQRWHIYRLAVDPVAAPLFECRAQQTHQRTALIVASETYATQPQLPRDYYGGDTFQQACIDAQDQQFDHILVLSPKHGVISLDEMVPSETTWDEMLDRRVWEWQLQAAQRMSHYLAGEVRVRIPDAKAISWWEWFHPESVFEFTVFGSGFAVRVLMDHLAQISAREPEQWPRISLIERRPGYDAGDLGDDLEFDLDGDDDVETAEWGDLDFDIDHLMELAEEFASTVNIYVAPTGETWELEPDEALLPMRLLTASSMDSEDMLDLLTDVMLLLEQPLPISLIVNAGMAVSVLLQITHSLVHDERGPISEMLQTFPEPALHQYIERALQETRHEDQLCACMTLAEQLHLLALAIPPQVSDQLLVWLQTYLSSRLRQRLLGSMDDSQD